MKARQDRRSRRTGAAIGAAVLLAMSWTAAGAQTIEPDTLQVHLTTTSPLLPADHWVVDALRKAQALGLTEDYLPSARAITRNSAGHALGRVVNNASSRDPALSPLAGQWQRQLQREFPELSPEQGESGSDGLRLLGSSLSAGYERWTGRAAPGLAEFPPDRTGALALPRVDHPSATLSLAGAASRHFALEVTSQLRRGELDLVVADASLGWRRWMVSVGRRPVSYGIINRESILLSAQVPLDRVQVETREPVRIGGPFRHLGPLSLHTFLARLPDERHPGRPFLWGARIAAQPHQRLDLSLQRAAMFGGEAAEPITVRRLLLVLVGSVEGATFENQILSVAFRYRLPIDDLLPLTVHGEWGTEDGSGAPWDVPGLTMGILAPVLPGLREANLGLEYSRFSPSCCGNPPWYRHFGFPGSWSGADQPLGHPLAGEGSEVRIRSQVYLAQGRLRIEGDGFSRRRSGENLFVPGRSGDSLGMRLGVNLEMIDIFDLGGFLSSEAGNDWDERRIELQGTLFLPGAR